MDERRRRRTFYSSKLTFFCSFSISSHHLLRFLTALTQFIKSFQSDAKETHGGQVKGKHKWRAGNRKCRRVVYIYIHIRESPLLINQEIHAALRTCLCKPVLERREGERWGPLGIVIRGEDRPWAPWIRISFCFAHHSVGH